MDNKKFRNGMLFGIAGAVLTLLGDLMIGADFSSDLTTGSQMVDMFIDGAGNSELRMAVGGMLGAVGIPITALGYYELYERLFKPRGGIMPAIYKLAVFATAALYNMAVGAQASYILAWAIGRNAVGNGIGTGAISIGHLYMFTMLYADRPREYRMGES